MREWMYRGIDVSMYQGKIDWDAVKAAGIDFAILRAGFGKYSAQKDTTFERNYRECRRVGIPVGVYWYSYAKTAADARQEAEACLEILEGRQLEFPVAYDLEEQASLANGTELCKAFCEAIEQAGYYAAIYSFKHALEASIAPEVRQRYDIFLSHIGVSESNYAGAYGVWQYSWTGSVDGIVGEVDLDYAYKDYPKLIRAAGLNGYGAAAPEAMPQPEDAAAQPSPRDEEPLLEQILSHVTSIDHKLGES